MYFFLRICKKNKSTNKNAIQIINKTTWRFYTDDGIIFRKASAYIFFNSYCFIFYFYYDNKLATSYIFSQKIKHFLHKLCYVFSFLYLISFFLFLFFCFIFLLFYFRQWRWFLIQVDNFCFMVKIFNFLLVSINCKKVCNFFLSYIVQANFYRTIYNV